MNWSIWNICTDVKAEIFQGCVHFYFTGDSVLHLATRAENEKAAIFLATNGARAGLSNHKVGCFKLYL